MKDSKLIRASYLLSREFGWLPQQIRRLTMAQISLYLEMIREEGRAATHDERRPR